MTGDVFDQVVIHSVVVNVVFEDCVVCIGIMEWSNEVIMEFVDLYEEEPAIRNPHLTFFYISH